MKEKFCPACKLNKRVSEFHKNKGSFDGLGGYCKNCHYSKYKDSYIKRASDWQKKNSASHTISVKKWQSKNIERVKMIQKVWWKDNPQKRSFYGHKRRTLKNNCEGKYTLQEWTDLCEQYNNKCLSCGEKKKLTVDHIVPLSLGGSNNIDNLQPLCFSCNSSKHTKIMDFRESGGGYY